MLGRRKSKVADVESIPSFLARREAEKRVQNIASNTDMPPDAQAYFQALRQTQEQTPALTSRASSRIQRRMTNSRNDPPPTSSSTTTSSTSKLGFWQRKFRRPLRVQNREERFWTVTEWLLHVVNFLAIIFFFFSGFFLHSNDKKMDPIAWRLAFGVTAVFILFASFQLLFEYTRLFVLWLVVVFLLVAGLSYGSFSFFFKVYESDFPCFRGYSLGMHVLSMCYEGRLFVGLTAANLYLMTVGFYLWRWQSFKRRLLIRLGELEQELQLTDLLSTEVDRRMETLEANYSRGVARRPEDVLREQEEARLLPASMPSTSSMSNARPMSSLMQQPSLSQLRRMQQVGLLNAPAPPPPRTSHLPPPPSMHPGANYAEPSSWQMQPGTKMRDHDNNMLATSYGRRLGLPLHVETPPSPVPTTASLPLPDVRIRD